MVRMRARIIYILLGALLLLLSCDASLPQDRLIAELPDIPIESVIIRTDDGKSIECGISEPLYEDYIGIALEVFAYRHGIPVLYGRKDAEDVKVELIPSSSIGLGLKIEKEEGGISASIIDYPGTTIKWFVNGIEIEGNGSFIVISYDDEALKDNTEDALNTLLATVSTENNVIFSATGYFLSRDGGICK